MTRLRVAGKEKMQMSGLTCACLGAADMRGLCPHMKYPRLRRGIFICVSENPTLSVGFKKAYNYAGNIKTPFDLIKYRCGLATARTNQKEVIQKMNDTKSLAHEMELQISCSICTKV